jgi:hypothetical protein
LINFEEALTMVTTFCLPLAKLALSNSSATWPPRLTSSLNISGPGLSPPGSVTSRLTSPGWTAGSITVALSRPICAVGAAASSLARELRGAGPLGPPSWPIRTM